MSKVTVREIRRYIGDGLALATKRDNRNMMQLYSMALDAIESTIEDGFIANDEIVYDPRSICPARNGRIVFDEVKGFISNSSHWFLLHAWDDGDGSKSVLKSHGATDNTKHEESSEYDSDSTPYLFGFSSSESDDHVKQ